MHKCRYADERTVITQPKATDIQSNGSLERLTHLGCHNLDVWNGCGRELTGGENLTLYCVLSWTTSYDLGLTESAKPNLYLSVCLLHARYIMPLIEIIFVAFSPPNLSQVFPVLVAAYTDSCVGPQNKLGHLDGCRFPCWVPAEYKKAKKKQQHTHTKKPWLVV